MQLRKAVLQYCLQPAYPHIAFVSAGSKASTTTRRIKMLMYAFEPRTDMCVRAEALDIWTLERAPRSEEVSRSRGMLLGMSGAAILGTRAGQVYKGEREVNCDACRRCNKWEMSQMRRKRSELIPSLSSFSTNTGSSSVQRGYQGECGAALSLHHVK